MKICRKCKQEKPLEAFNKKTDSKDGRQYACRSCDKEYREANKERKAATQKAWSDANKERKHALTKAWQQSNKDRVSSYGKAWREANKERHAANVKAWSDSNRGKVNATEAKRRASKLQRTPPWADQEEMDKFYKLSSFLTKIMGFPYHVDHELPLQGKLVSGLHTHQNLRVVPAEDNLRKGNSFCPNSK